MEVFLTVGEAARQMKSGVFGVGFWRSAMFFSFSIFCAESGGGGCALPEAMGRGQKVRRGAPLSLSTPSLFIRGSEQLLPQLAPPISLSPSWSRRGRGHLSLSLSLPPPVAGFLFKLGFSQKFPFRFQPARFRSAPEEMSHTSSESDNRSRMTQKDQAESPSTDEGNSGVSFSGGGGSLKKGPWTSAEDAILVDYVKKHGEGNWNAVQKHSGLSRCGKSCRLRWANHLRPNLKKGAFTPEEEQLIIELHARMGNKWARMAAHLPGRTDNEIKNYWNTRIKRCQRAGLPLYPPNIRFESLNENQSQNGNDFSVGDKRNNEHLQSSSFDILDVTFDNFKANQGLSYMPPFPDISVSSMPNQGLGSQNYDFVPPTLDRFKQLPGSETLFPSFHCHATCELPAFEQFSSSEKIHWPLGIDFPYDPDPGSKKLAPLADLVSGSHTLPNGNFSTSQTLPVAAKLELPSLQYPETDLSSWLMCSPTPPEAVDAFVESPLTVSVQSDCGSPRNSGLLEALLHEAQAMGTGKNKPSEKSSNSSTVIPSDLVQSSVQNLCYTEGDYSDPVSPMGHSTASVSGECTPLTGGSSLDESSTGKRSIGLIVKSEPVEHMPSQNVEGMEISPRLGFSRPDELLGSDWCPNDSKDQATFSDAIANLLGESVGSDYRHVPTGPSSVLTQGLGGINSCPWSYMPPVCQMSELP